MFILLVIAALGLWAISASIYDLRTDGYHRVPTRAVPRN
jgi:hypothetical protein